MYKKLSLLTSLWIGLCTACTSPHAYFEESGSVFHTRYHIKYQAARSLAPEIEAELDRFDRSLNPFNPEAIIAKINRNEETETDAWFREVFLKAQEISRRTDGIFDITCAPLVNAWGFGFNKIDSVTPHTIDSIKTFVGYRKVRLEGNRIVKDDPRLLLNCSAIAKGFASDVIARLLERHGIENYMVEIGGEVAMNGINAQGDFWRIGINKPEDDSRGMQNDIEEVIQLGGKGGVATSGNYRNFYVKDGQKFAHTIDPRTGYPALGSILSATVVAPDCMTADAYATAFMAMGLDKAREIAATIPDLEFFFIYADEKGKQKVAYSEGMLPYLPNRKTLAILENP